MSNFFLFALGLTVLYVIYYTIMFINDLFNPGDKKTNNIEEIAVVDIQESPTFVKSTDISEHIIVEELQEKDEEGNDGQNKQSSGTSSPQYDEEDLKIVVKEYQMSFDPDETLKTSTMNMFYTPECKINHENLQ